MNDIHGLEGVQYPIAGFGTREDKLPKPNLLNSHARRAWLDKCSRNVSAVNEPRYEPTPVLVRRQEHKFNNSNGYEPTPLPARRQEPVRAQPRYEPTRYESRYTEPLKYEPIPPPRRVAPQPKIDYVGEAKKDWSWFYKNIIIKYKFVFILIFVVLIVLLIKWMFVNDRAKHPNSARNAGIAQYEDDITGVQYQVAY